MCSRFYFVLRGNRVCVRLVYIIPYNDILALFSYITDYLNQPWVREEIGIDPSARNFTPVSWDVNTGFEKAGDALHQTEFYVAELLERGVRVLIYAGTYDASADWVANERWTLEMEWSGQEGFRSQDLKQWKIKGEPMGKFRSFANLTFATIYGAGHMVSRKSLPARQVTYVLYRFPMISLQSRWSW